MLSRPFVIINLSQRPRATRQTPVSTSNSARKLALFGQKYNFLHLRDMSLLTPPLSSLRICGYSSTNSLRHDENVHKTVEIDAQQGASHHWTSPHTMISTHLRNKSRVRPLKVVCFPLSHQLFIYFFAGVIAPRSQPTAFRVLTYPAAVIRSFASCSLRKMLCFSMNSERRSVT